MLLTPQIEAKNIVRKEKVEKAVQKNGEETLTPKSPYLIMRDLGLILIDK